MPRHTARRSFLAPDTIWQLKTLFGTGTNAHARLGLHELVPRAELQKALAGYPVREDHERLIMARWGEWRREFLADPEVCINATERNLRHTGDFYDVNARDVVTEKLSFPLARFTLQPDAGKHL